MKTDEHSDTYQINDRDEVVPYTAGRKCTDTRTTADKFLLITIQDAMARQSEDLPIYYRVRDVERPDLMRPFQRASRDHIIVGVDDYAVLEKESL